MNKNLLNNLRMDDISIGRLKDDHIPTPKYNANSYYKSVANNSYFAVLATIRHYLKFTSDEYFGVKLNAKNMDLFMFTPSISSPSGRGSDSKPIPFRLGKENSFLTDSSQFGFEPFLIKNLQRVYCYLPSMRGDKPDERHLNQFFHCEFEMVGRLEDVMKFAEGYVKEMCNTLLSLKNCMDKISDAKENSRRSLKRVVNSINFPEISFDEATNILKDDRSRNLIRFGKYGSTITTQGEIRLAQILNLNIPFWIKYFDRDQVAFYQKPVPHNPAKVLNADLIFPPLLHGSFGGEILGSRQKQDNVKELFDSLERQNISPAPYEWYIDLRRQKDYRITSGFGLGIERFIAWALAKKNIKDVIAYPRLKNFKTMP